jgi:hypothetical protein
VIRRGAEAQRHRETKAERDEDIQRLGSLYLQTQLIIAQNLGFIPDGASDAIYESSKEIERMLSALINRIGSK